LNKANPIQCNHTQYDQDVPKQKSANKSGV
jgi:hypothetical protein